jgi:tetratricopeptide (TPR) repeat protein
MAHAPPIQDVKALLDEGKWEESVQVINTLLNRFPQSAPLHYLLGLAYVNLNITELALSSFQNACYLEPRITAAWVNQVVVLIGLGRLDVALTEINRSLKINPGNIMLVRCLGSVLLKMEQWNEAQTVFQEIVKKGECDPDDYTHLGISLLEQGDHFSAVESCRKALEVSPGNSNALYNLGISLKDCHKLLLALQCFEELVQSEPDYPGVHGNYATTLFLLGRYSEGWREYEWRLVETPAIIEIPPLPKYTIKMGRVECILVVCEQGLGDSLQFIRFIDHLSDFSNMVKVSVQSPVAPLIRSSYPKIEVINGRWADEDLRGVDSWIPLIDCASLLNVKPDCPAALPTYLVIRDELVHKWSQMLGCKTKKRVAIAWQGNPVAERGHQKNRSMNLLSLEPLFLRDDIEVVSLQKGFGSEQIDQLGWRARFHSAQDLVDDVWDFEEVGAILRNCDTLVSVDTSITHLSGAIGCPSVLLLKWTPDWRWGLEGDSTFWYPSHRLVRQRQGESWRQTVERMVNDLF